MTKLSKSCLKMSKKTSESHGKGPQYIGKREHPEYGVLVTSCGYCDERASDVWKYGGAFFCSKDCCYEWAEGLLDGI